MDTLRGADAYLVLAMISAAQEGRAQAVVGVTSDFKEQARESLWLYLSCPIRHAAAVASGVVVDEGKRATTLALLRRQLQGSGLTGDAVLRGCARAFGDWLAYAEPGTHLAQQPPPPPCLARAALPVLRQQAALGAVSSMLPAVARAVEAGTEGGLELQLAASSSADDARLVLTAHALALPQLVSSLLPPPRWLALAMSRELSRLVLVPSRTEDARHEQSLENLENALFRCLVAGAVCAADSDSACAMCWARSASRSSSRPTAPQWCTLRCCAAALAA